MAVPKRRTSRMRMRTRRASAWTITMPGRSLCPRCGDTKRPHVVCPNCGWYKDRQAIEVD